MAKKIHKRKEDGRDDERHEYLSRTTQGHWMICMDARSLYECARCHRRALIFDGQCVIGLSSDPCPYGEV